MTAEGLLDLFGIHALLAPYGLMVMSVLPDEPLAWALRCVHEFP